MMQTIIATLSNFMKREHAWAEFWSAFALLVWGTQAMIDAGPVHLNPAYGFAFGVIMSPFLESLAILIGVLQFYSLVGQKIGLRLFSAFAATFVYALLLVSFASHALHTPGWSFVGALLGINVFAVARLTKGYR